MSEKHDFKHLSVDNGEFYIEISLIDKVDLKVKCFHTKTEQEWVIFANKFTTIDKEHHMMGYYVYDLLFNWINNKKKTYQECIIHLPEVAVDGSLYLTIIQVNKQMTFCEVYRVKFTAILEDEEESNREPSDAPKIDEKIKELKENINKLTEKISDLEKDNQNFKSIFKYLSHYIIREMK